MLLHLVRGGKHYGPNNDNGLSSVNSPNYRDNSVVVLLGYLQQR